MTNSGSQPETKPAPAWPASRAERNAGEIYTPKNREMKPAKLTVDQFLKQVNFNEGIGGLVRSIYGTKIMTFGEWETTVNTLLKRQVR
jgi:hypothetical protein